MTVGPSSPPDPAVRRAFVTLLVIAFAVAAPVPQSYAAGAEVHILNGAPNPSELTINEGDTVTFVNDDDVSHAIFEDGTQHGTTIEPHTRSVPFGPFETGGQDGRADYTVDQNGAPGSIFVRGSNPTTTESESTTTVTIEPATTETTATTAITATTKVPSTTSTTAASKTTSTSSTTTTTPATTSSSTSTSRPVAAPTSTDQNDSKRWLAWAGLVLGLIGIANMIRVMTRPKYGRDEAEEPDSEGQA